MLRLLRRIEASQGRDNRYNLTSFLFLFSDLIRPQKEQDRSFKKYEIFPTSNVGFYT